MKNAEDDSKAGSVRPRDALVGLLLIALGAAAEYVDEFLLQGAFQPPVDPFPPYILSWDARIFLLINNGLANPYLGWVFNILTRLGSTFFMLVIGILLYVCRRRREGILILASIVVGTFVALPLKLAIPRPRPFATIPTTIVFDKEAGSSFPSGHAVRTFAFAFIASKLRPRLAIPLYLFACLIAFSRVYVGQHYPLDAFAGALIGLLVGYLTMRNERRVLKAVSQLGVPTRDGASRQSLVRHCTISDSWPVLRFSEAS